VHPRDGWEALQARIAAARAALDAGDRGRALLEIEAALAIDPGFLAAQSLRDRILDSPSEPAWPGSASPDRGAPLESDLPLNPAAVATDRYARFEERARRRRVDRRLDAARAALAARRLREAAAALEEIAELDPNLPELAPLIRHLEFLRQQSSRSPAGAWLAAVAAFVAIILGASWLEESRILTSRPVQGIGLLVSAPAPNAITMPADAGVDLDAIAADAEPIRNIGTSGLRGPGASVSPAAAEPRSAPATTTAARPEPSVSVPPPAPPVPAAAESAPPPAPAAPPQPVRPTSAAPVERASMPPDPAPQPLNPQRAVSAARGSPDPTPSASVPRPSASPLDDEMLVKLALQRYRAAYEELDARSARAVWPAVNESALARAFDGLESQHLTFEDCTVRVGGDRAAATCRGTATYVPKVGSRQPRVEPRTWTFALHKAGAEWKIDAARVER
jgi:hypothetical protein